MSDDDDLNRTDVELETLCAHTDTRHPNGCYCDPDTDDEDE